MHVSSPYVHYYGGIDPSLYLTVDEANEEVLSQQLGGIKGLGLRCTKNQHQADILNESRIFNDTSSDTPDAQNIQSTELIDPKHQKMSPLEGTQGQDFYSIKNEHQEVFLDECLSFNDITVGNKSTESNKTSEETMCLEEIEDFGFSLSQQQTEVFNESPSFNYTNSVKIAGHDKESSTCFSEASEKFICPIEGLVFDDDDINTNEFHEDKFDEFSMIVDDSCSVEEIHPTLVTDASKWIMHNDVDMGSNSSLCSSPQSLLSVPASPSLSLSPPYNAFINADDKNKLSFRKNPCLSPTDIKNELLLMFVTDKNESSSEQEECFTTPYPRKITLPQDKDGDTNLHILISREEERFNTQSCLVLIPSVEKGLKGLDTVNHMGQTALHLASYLNNITTTRCLLMHGADPLLLDKDGNSCLHIACKLNFNELVSCIVETVEETGKKKVRKLLALTNGEGLSAMHIAAKSANTKILFILYEHGGNVDIKDDCSKKTSLMYACESAQVEAARVLVERLYADVNILSASDCSAVHFAAEANSAEIVKLLCRNGAQLGLKTAFLKTEKELATQKDVKALIDRSVKKQKRHNSSSL